MDMSKKYMIGMGWYAEYVDVDLIKTRKLAAMYIKGHKTIESCPITKGKKLVGTVVYLKSMKKYAWVTESSKGKKYYWMYANGKLGKEV